MGFIELVFLRALRACYVAAILFVVVFVGVTWGLGTDNPLQGAAVADLLLATGWIWGKNTRAAEKLAGRP